LLLSPDLYKRAPISEFFTVWSKDKARMPSVAPISQVSKVELVVADLVEEESPLSLMSLPQPSSPTSSEASISVHELRHKPTFEQFVKDLASSLGVDSGLSDSDNDKQLDRDTVVESKPSMQLPSMPPSIALGNVRDSVSVATVLDDDHHYSVFAPFSLPKCDSQRDTVAAPMSSQNSGASTEPPTATVASSLYRQSLTSNVSGCYAEGSFLSPYYSPATKLSITTSVLDTRAGAAVSIPSRKESRNWSSESPLSKQLKIITTVESSESPLTNQVRQFPVPFATPVASRTDSLDRNASLGRDRNTLVKESLGTLLRATLRRETPAANPAPAENTRQQAFEAFKKVTLDRNKSCPEPRNSPLEYTSPLTIRLVISKSAPIYVPISRQVDFDGLLDQVSLSLAKSPAAMIWRKLPPPNEQMVAVQFISYRNATMEMILLENDDDWQLCKEGVHKAEKLTLFVSAHQAT